MRAMFIFLTLSVVGISNLALANSVFCPATVVCKNQKCIGNPMPNPSFGTVVLASTPIPDGTYYFSEAWADSARAQCSYRSQEGNTWAYFKPNAPLAANLQPKSPLNAWIAKLNYCGPNTNAPYLADPKGCPFIPVSNN